MRGNFDTKVVNGANKEKNSELLNNNVYPHKGVIIGTIIIFLWLASLTFFLNIDIETPLIIAGILLQTYLYTGIFITAHDAMHGTVSRNSTINTAIGKLCTLLFAFNNYNKLYHKHHLHHKHPATEEDPDYHNGKFLAWYFSFLKQYISIWQIIFMAITYNVLKYFFTEINVLLFWALPSVLSTFQLFYFGTYLPHKGAHDIKNAHKARSQNKNHTLALLTCYFFGYHYEHHDKPYVPWWQLYKTR
ncbi:fatty acid desaturase [Cytophagaceae bacterium ABcell3]|nr:fatty acid desaturase [Cytophagaceae bacterium ABcell3]